VIQGDEMKYQIDFSSFQERLLQLFNGESVEGFIAVKKRFWGLTGYGSSKEEIAIKFRLHNSESQYKTPKNGWQNPRFGHALLLLLGEEFTKLHKKSETKWYFTG